MGRPRRVAVGGWVYHVLNRANARLALFECDDDYAAFERILAEGVDRYRPRLLAYCLMPNHWHLLVWPEQDDVLSQFVGWVTLTHTQRLHAHRGTAGEGHIYQGRFKSFPVQEDEHFYAVARYVERNPLRAGLVGRAEEWRWSSLVDKSHGSRLQGDAARGGVARGGVTRGDGPQSAKRRANSRRAAGPGHGRADDATTEDAGTEPFAAPVLSKWPVARPGDWRRLVNRVQSEGELAALRRSTARGVPYGGPRWTTRAAEELDLETTLRPRGRPKKGA